MNTMTQLRRTNCMVVLTVLLGVLIPVDAAARTVQVRTKNGIVEGAVSADGEVRMFKGIPYAAPPVGPLRWKPPQPAPSWTGVRKAVEFGPRCMQGHFTLKPTWPLTADVPVFRDDGPSEDCLYLNVWIPERAKKPLPVMVWFHPNALVEGSGSEPQI